MRAYLFTAIVSSLLTAACAGEYGATFTTGYAPELVEVSPGVQVIADYSEPIFFADGFYWRLDGATWYRSTYYTGGWAYAPPPPALLRIDRPHQYTHYRPHGWQPRRYEARPAPAPVVRDHRRAPPPPPVVRDHRRPLPPPPPRNDRDRDHGDDHRR